MEYGINPNPVIGEYAAPSEAGFTLRQIFDALAKFEAKRRACPFGVWFGGIDAHHVHFQGFEVYEDTWLRPLWGPPVPEKDARESPTRASSATLQIKSP